MVTIESLTAELEAARAALRWHKDNDTVPGSRTDAGCGCCSEYVTVPEDVQAALRAAGAVWSD